MTFLSWLPSHARRRPAVGRLMLEPLEDRLVPAPFAFTARFETAPSGNDQLVRLDLGQNADVTVGTDLGFPNIVGMDFDPLSGQLYAVAGDVGVPNPSFLSRLILINTQTGVGFTHDPFTNTNLGFLGVDTFTDVGLSFAPDGRLFMANFEDDTFYQINRQTGAAVQIAKFPSLTGVTGMSFAPDGTLYAVTSSFDPKTGAFTGASVLTIDPNTGAINSSIPLFIEPSTATAQTGFIDINHAPDGTLYGLGALGEVFIIDPTTGNSTLHLATNDGEFFSLAVEQPPPPPPPPPPTPPTPPTPLTPLFSVGTNPTTQAFVNVYNADATPRFIFNPFPGFTGSIRTATGDVNGDKVDDVIVSVSGDGPPAVKVYNGVNGAEMYSFYAFDVGFRGGVNVSLTDLNGDGSDDLVIGAASTVSHVKVLDGKNLTLLASFIAFPGYAGGVSVGGGDVNGDGFGDVIVGTAKGAGHVKAFSGNGLGELASFMVPNGPGLGLEVTAGDFNGDGKAEIVAAVSGAAVVDVFDPVSLDLLTVLQPYPGYNSRIGVSTADLNKDGKAELITASLSGPSAVIVSDPLTQVVFDSFIAFPSAKNPVPR
jgi:hypothetical protein